MASPTIDPHGIEPVVSAPTKMDSLDTDVISETEWRAFAHNMQIFDPKVMQELAQSCKPKLLRRFFSSDMASRNLHETAKLGKTDVMKVLLALGRADANKFDGARHTALHYAAREGHLDIVCLLLKERYIEPNLPDGDGNTALHNAAMHGHVLVVDMFLKAPEVDVNKINDYKQTALILAAGRGHAKIVDKLLKMPNVKVTLEDKLVTPLHAAAKHGHAVIVEMLLGKVDVNFRDCYWRQSPLHLAVEGGHENVVDLLLRAPNVEASLKDFTGDTPLHIAAKEGNGSIFGKLLQVPGMDVNSANEEGWTALHLAAKHKHTNIISMLLDVPNIDPCPKAKKDKTPLHVAAMVGGTDTVQLLLEKGKADANITDSKKHTAIHHATKKGHLNVLDVLLQIPNVVPCLGNDDDNTPLHFAAKVGHRGIAERLLAIPQLDVNKVNKKNETPLFLAARFGSIDVVDLLLENPKVGISTCDHYGDSPFHVAVEGGHANIAKKLITHPSTDPIQCNKENVTALHLCIKKGHENLVDILLKQSTMDASIKDAYGNFPIHYAAKNGNTCIFGKILNILGVNVNSVNNHLETALHVAVKAGHVDVVDLLLKVPNLNANMQDQNGNSALHVAAAYDEEEIIEKLLKANGVDVNAKDEGGVTALVLAAKEGHERAFDKLWKVHDVLNNDEGVRSLILAARNGHNTIIKTLLAHGVNVNGIHGRDGPALCEAIQYRHAKVVEVLLKAPNIDPNRNNGGMKQPLIDAARCGEKAILEMLMATKLINVNVLYNGTFALQMAARSGKEQVVKLLLNTPNIDVYIKDSYGETALFDAARADNKDIMKDIYNASKVNVGSGQQTVQSHLNINDVNDDGESIIHIAAEYNFLNVMDFLLEVARDDARSVDVNLKTSPPKNGEDGFIPQNALQIAIDYQHNSIVEKLTKFDSISFTHEEDGTKTLLQEIFEKKQWETFKMVRRTKEATDYIDALYKDRQASVDAANAILVGAALIAGVTFASWLQPPLGYATYYHEQFSDTLPAPPTAYPEYAAFDHHSGLQAFWMFNSLSFFSAIATVISGARSVLPAKKVFIKQEVEDLRRNLLNTSILLGFSMFFVLLAFATAGVIVLPPVMKFRSNIFSTIGIGGSVCFIFLFLFGKNIYNLFMNIKNSQTKKEGFFEQWGFKSWPMPNLFTRSKGSEG